MAPFRSESVLSVSKIKPGYKQVADQLREMVIKGELKVDDRLPAEDELCTMFGVSRSTIREALRILSSQNLVVTLRGINGGSYITHPMPSEVSAYLEDTLGLLAGTNALDIPSFLEARIFLEAPAVGLAAKNRTQSDLDSLRALVEFDPSATESQEIFKKNWDFHLLIFHASGNKLLEVMARPLTTILRARFTRENVSRDYWDKIIGEHQRIFEAVRVGDSSTAEQEMRSHLMLLSSLYPEIDKNRIGK